MVTVSMVMVSKKTNYLICRLEIKSCYKDKDKERTIGNVFRDVDDSSQVRCV